jgi:hypothetical protein
MAEQMGLGAEMVPPWSVIPGGRAVAHTLSLPQGRGSIEERLWLAQRELGDWFGWLATRYGQPTHIGVEKPHAFNLQRIPVRQYELQGLILAALWGASTLGAPAQIGLVSPSSWKAAALGKGNGSAKPPAYVAWAARTFDWAPSRERPDDEAAALGIATYVALQAADGVVLRGAPVWGIDPQTPRVSVAVLVPTA